MADLTVNLLAGALKAGAERLFEAIGRSAREGLEKWDVESAAQALMKTRMARPLWNPSTEVDLIQFHYPCFVERGHRPIRPVDISSFEDPRVVLTGVVGQGKSVLLKFLARQELLTYSRSSGPLPLLLELRRLSGSLDELLVSALYDIGINTQAWTLDRILSSNAVSLLLDGFDECPRSAQMALLAKIESLGKRYPTLRILLTSRPDYHGVDQLQGFATWTMPPLSPSDRTGVLRAQYGERGQESANRLLREVQDSELWNLITTPLIAALMIVHYNAYQTLPREPESFFEDLFDALLRRHDASKPGFVRPRGSGLSDLDLRTWFDRLSLLALQTGSNVWTRSTMLEMANKAKPVPVARVAPEEFLNDVVKITALVQADTSDYRFVHKSILEYHAASYIAKLPEASAIRVYETLAGSVWTNWAQVLQFLSRIDRERYLRIFMIPAFEKLLEKPTLTRALGGKTFTISSTESGSSRPPGREYSLRGATVELAEPLTWAHATLRRADSTLIMRFRSLLAQHVDHLPKHEQYMFTKYGRVDVDPKLVDEALEGNWNAKRILGETVGLAEKLLEEARAELAKLHKSDLLIDFLTN